MVLTGSLIIGDSVRHSLEQATYYRLGEMTHLAAVTERYFRQEMAAEMEAAHPDIQAAPVLLLEGWLLPMAVNTCEPGSGGGS
jgi:putative ABC transport system permease protein